MPKRSASQRAPAAEWRPHSDRLSVITAGRVGNMEARLGASGFDVVAVAETEDALIDAVSADEPDAIVVEADLCASLEHVRDLAPDAVLIVVGDHTPAGALGRIERGVSGTAMAGLLHALVAEGAGAAVVWGLVPAFRPRGAMHVPMRMGGSLLSAKADLIRAYVANALGDHAELVTAASTVAVTVSASLVLTLGAPRTHERPERVRVPAPAVEHAPQHPVIAMSPTTRHPVVAVSSTARTPAHGPSTNEGEPGDRREPTRGESRDHGRHDDQGEDQDNDDQSEHQDNDDQGEDQDNDDQGEHQDNDDQGEDQDNDDQGENADQVEDESEDADEDADDESEDAAARARRTRGTRRTGHRRLDPRSSPEVLPAHRRWVGPPSWEFDAQ